MSRKRLDLITPDRMMRRMDGFEVLGATRWRNDPRGLPVIARNAPAIGASAVERGRLDVHAYRTKPVSAETWPQAGQETLKAAHRLSPSGGQALEIACGESWPGSAGEFLASALAAALAVHAPTLLIDVEGQGRGAMIFDTEPRLKAEDLEAGQDPAQGLIPIRGDLQVWSVYGKLSPPMVQRIADRLASLASFLVWMVGDPTGSAAVQVLPRCPRMLITFESHGPGMRRAQVVLRRLEELGLQSPRVWLIWVRRWVVPEPWTEIEIQNRLGGVPVRVWPVDPVTAYRALQDGRPIHEIEPESPTAYRIREWAEEILRLAKGALHEGF